MRVCFFFHFPTRAPFPHTTSEMDAGTLTLQLEEFRQVLIGINEDVSSWLECRSRAPPRFPTPSAVIHSSPHECNVSKRKEKKRRHHRQSAVESLHTHLPPAVVLPAPNMSTASCWPLSAHTPRMQRVTAPPPRRRHTLTTSLTQIPRSPQNLTKMKPSPMKTKKKPKKNSWTIPPRNLNA